MDINKSDECTVRKLLTFRHRIHSNTTYNIPYSTSNTNFIQTITQFPQSLEVIPPLAPTRPYFDYDNTILSSAFTHELRKQLHTTCLTTISQLFPSTTVHTLDSSRAVSTTHYKFSFHFIVSNTITTPTTIKELLLANNITLFDLSVYKKGEAYFRAPYCSKDDGYKLQYILDDFSPVPVDKLTKYGIQYTDLLVTYVNSSDNQLIDLNKPLNIIDNLPPLSSISQSSSQSPNHNKSDKSDKFLTDCIDAFKLIHPNAIPTVCTAEYHAATDIVTFTNINTPCAICKYQHHSNRSFMLVNYSKHSAWYKCHKRISNGFDDKLPLTIHNKPDTLSVTDIQDTYFDDLNAFVYTNPTVEQIKLFMLGCIMRVVSPNGSYYLMRTKIGYEQYPLSRPPFYYGIEKDLYVNGDKSMPYRKVFGDLILEPIFTNNNQFIDVGFYPLSPNTNIAHVQTPDGRIFNTWKGFPYASKEYIHDQQGLDFIIEFIQSLCGFNPTIFDYVIKWIANIIQHPQDKQTALVFISVQGVGKGRLFNLLSRLLKYTILIENTSELFGQFTSTVADMLLVGIDEAREGSIVDHDKFKNLIMEKKTVINEKYKKQYVSNNFTKYMMFSNNHNCIKIEPGCRRFVMIECSSINVGNISYFRQLTALFDNLNTLGTIFNHLLNIDLSNFNANIPIKTDLCIQTALQSLNSADHFMLQLITESTTIKDYTPEEFYQLYSAYADSEGITRKLTKRTLGDHMSKSYGVKTTFKFINGRSTRVYTIDPTVISQLLTAKIGSTVSITDLL